MARSSWPWLVSLPALACALLARTGAAAPQSGVVGWGGHVFDPHLKGESFARVWAGGDSTIALRSNGRAVGWGESYWRQSDPPAPPAGLGYVEISIAPGSGPNYIDENHVLGLRSDGSLVAWGPNAYGECNVPTLPAGIHFTSASAGSRFSVASKSDGTLRAWGDNGSGQLNTPAPPPGLSFVRVAAGYSHALGLLSNGVVLGWGSSSGGALNVPSLPSGLSYVDITAGFFFSAALRSDGAVIAWGFNNSGQCNVPALPPGLTYTQVRAGQAHVLALRSDGALIAWGYNGDHECDVPPPPPGTSYVQVAAGGAHSVALRSDGRVVCWGDNRKFQCNASELPAGLAYTKFAGSSFDEGYISSPRGQSFLLALRSDGAIEVWGRFQPAPALPPGLVYVDVAAGRFHALALRSDGTVAAWGSNFNGACNIPALPAGLRYVGIAASGSDHYDTCGFGYEWELARSFLLRSDGALLKFGDDGLGQLDLPAPPAGLHYVEIAAAGFHTTGRLSDGTAAGSGYLGAGPGAPPGQSWIQFDVKGGDYYETDCSGQMWLPSGHGLGLLSDGSIYAYGSTAFDEQNVPSLPPGLVYVEVACSEGISTARRSDGSVVGWGNSTQGVSHVPVLPAGEAYTRIGAGTFGCVAAYEVGLACGTVVRTCSPALANSATADGATLEASGCPGITANNLVLNVSGLPPSTLGMFLYGSNQQQVPFGNGWGCIGGSVQRVLPPLVASSSGTVSFPVDLAQYPFTGSSNPILPSSGWFFQYWYRDPAASPATFNTSDALHVCFAP